MFAERWRLIKARVDGIAAAATLHAQLQVNSSDTYSALKTLGRSAAAALDELRLLISEFTPALPNGVSAMLDKFVVDRASLFEEAKANVEAARGAIPLLAGLVSELSVLVQDQQVTLRLRVERAFLHLQQRLAADPREREVWKEAFGQGEVRCEALGSAHLLLHGLLAFKAHASGARTDLVFAEPIDEAVSGRGVEGLVLTEWKVGDRAGAQGRYDTAFAQICRYAAGPLSGVDLAGYRYLVLVTEGRLPATEIPPDRLEAGIIYRHINIAVDPEVPSREPR